MNSAQKNNKSSIKAGSTQKFTEIEDIKEDIVLLSGGSACLVIEIQATNFALLSKEEQDMKVNSYASLLNSLSFPVQIIIRNKKVDIASYLTHLTERIKKIEEGILPSNDPLSETKQQRLLAYMKNYKEFVSELVKFNTVLDKKFYISISYSYLEKGPQINVKGNDFLTSAKATLHTKAESLLGQLLKLSVRAKILQKDDLVKLFYDVYNQESDTPLRLDTMYEKAPIVTGQK